MGQVVGMSLHRLTLRKRISLKQIRRSDRFCGGHLYDMLSSVMTCHTNWIQEADWIGRSFVRGARSIRFGGPLDWKTHTETIKPPIPKHYDLVDLILP